MVFLGDVMAYMVDAHQNSHLNKPQFGQTNKMWAGLSQ